MGSMIEHWAKSDSLLAEIGGFSEIPFALGLGNKENGG
jgi:hypothetical protein